ncbi:LysR family transcriptional regulator [Vibrio sp. WJH972]
MNWSSICFDWNRTRAFLVTAEEGTLSAAAKALGMTQPTLSRQILALESEIGVSLFERSGHRLVLTSSGVELLNVARDMGEAASRFSMIAKGHSEDIEGTVVISVCELDATYRMPPILAKLRVAEPKITIEVLVTNDVSDLKRREADIAIRNVKPTQPNLIARKLGEERVNLYGTHQYLSAFADCRSTKDIQDDLQIIGFGQNHQIIEQLNHHGWQLHDGNFKLSTSFQPMQIELCRAHLGLVYLTEDVGARDTQIQRAFETLVPPIHLSVWLVCHEELRTNLHIRRVFDLLATEYQHLLDCEKS